MKANKALIAIAIMIAVVASCKKSDLPPAAPQKTVLSTINNSAVGSYSYTYDASGILLSEVYNGNASNPGYTATNKNYDTKGRVVEVKVEYLSFPSNNYKTIISYNDNGKIERKQNYDYTGNSLGYTQFFYSTGTQAMKIYSAAGALLRTDEYTFSADGANVITYKTFNSSGTLISTTDYGNFDSKKSTDALYPYGFFDYPGSQNNYRSLSKTTASTGTVTSYTVAYTYNDDGYPVKRTNSTGGTIDYSYLKK